MANIITSLRIILSLGLIFCPTFSIPFYIIYLLAGISDMIDGPIARKLNKVSEFGSKLDTIADFIFLMVTLIKTIPNIDLSISIILWIILIAVIKVFSVLFGFINKGRLVVVHTVLDKVTGFVLFLLPLTISFLEISYTSIIVCIIATIAAIDEFYNIRLTINKPILL